MRRVPNQHDIETSIPPVWPDDVTRAKAALNLVALGQDEEVADMLGVGDL